MKVSAYNVVSYCFLPKAVEITPPYTYKENPCGVYLPEIPLTPRDYRCSAIPDKVDNFPRIGSVPKLPPLPSIAEQEGLVLWFDVTLILHPCLSLFQLWCVSYANILYTF